tara:strand:- start:756 stop:959 length:204 start_codon:yes stop_codon:yes gene_type:complete
VLKAPEKIQVSLASWPTLSKQNGVSNAKIKVIQSMLKHQRKRNLVNYKSNNVPCAIFETFRGIAKEV